MEAGQNAQWRAGGARFQFLDEAPRIDDLASRLVSWAVASQGQGTMVWCGATSAWTLAREPVGLRE